MASGKSISQGNQEMYTKFWLEKLKKRESYGYLHVERRMQFKSNFGESVCVCVCE